MVSVIVPVYKAEKYLEECVGSILGQDYTDLELILVDDGSPDNSPALCDRLAADDKRVKVIHKPNGGAASARNAGIDAAVGEYVTFVDSDDALTPEAISFLVDLIKKNNSDFAIASIDDMQYPLPEQEIWEKFIPQNEVVDFIFRNLGNMYSSSPCSKLYRASLMPRFYEELAVGEDLLFNIEFVGKIGSIAVSNRRVYRYRRQVEMSLTNAYYPGKHRVYYRSYLRMCDAAEKLGASERQMSDLRYHFIRMILNCMTCVYIQSDRTKEWKLSEIKEICRDADVKAQAEAWQAQGLKSKSLRRLLIGANAGALYNLCALEIARQNKERRG